MHLFIFAYISFISIKVLLIQNIMLLQNQFIIPMNFLQSQTIKNVSSFFVITTCIIGFSIAFIIIFKHIRQIIINSKIKELNEE